MKVIVNKMTKRKSILKAFGDDDRIIKVVTVPHPSLRVMMRKGITPEEIVKLPDNNNKGVKTLFERKED